MRAALLIARKDLKVLSRDRVALFWVVLFPLAFSLFFGTVLDSAIDRALGGSAAVGAPSGFLRALPAGVLWGLISCAATFAVGIVSERTRGTLQRLCAAPTTASALLGGKALACFVACVLVAALLVTVAVIGFDARVDHPLSLLLAVLSTAAGFVGITVLFGVSGRSEQAVAGAGWGVLLAAAMFGGAMVPTSLMPEWLQDVGAMSPVRWGLVAFENALWGGGTTRELLVHCLALLALGGVGVTAGGWLLRRSLRS